MSNAELIAAGVVAAGTGIAAAHDVATRRVPNAVSLAMAAAGLGLAAAGVSGISLWSAIAGAGLGLALMLPGHLYGATGAGDVKLLAASGAVIGAGRIVEAFAFTAIAGGLVALAVAWQRGRLRRTMARTARLCVAPAAGRAELESTAEQSRFPYAPAIAVGVVLAALR